MARKTTRKLSISAPSTKYSYEPKNLSYPEQVKAMKADEVKRRQESFLHAYSLTGSLQHAEMASKISRQNHYLWMREDPTYKERFDRARVEAIDSLESEAFKRAMQGSDTLLMFLLKGNAPGKYRDSMKIDNNTTVTHIHKDIDIDSLTAKDCEEILTLLAERAKPQLEEKPPEVKVISVETNSEETV